MEDNEDPLTPKGESLGSCMGGKTFRQKTVKPKILAGKKKVLKDITGSYRMWKWKMNILKTKRRIYMCSHNNSDLYFEI